MFKNLLQYGFALLVILNLTNLFVFASAWFGISLTITGGLILLGLAFYLVSERRTVASFIRNPVVIVCSILFFVWPLIYAIIPTIQGYSVKREIVLQTYYLLLFYGTITYVIRNGLLAGQRLVFVCFSITIFGIVSETFYPEFFYGIAIPGEEVAESFAYGRAGGFFINPNNGGRFVILMYLLLQLSPRPIPLTRLILLSAITFGVVLLTASRSSMAVAILAILGVFAARYAVEWADRRMMFRPERLFLSLIGLPALGLILFISLGFFGAAFANFSGLGQSAGASDRLRFFTTGFSGLVEVVEEEALVRYYTVEPYIPAFKETWTLGRGLAGYRIYRGQTGIDLTPHNTLFVLWFDYGIAYILVVCFATYRFLVSQRTRRAERHAGIAFSFIFVGAIFVIMFTFDALMTQRPTYVVLGFLLACSSAPPAWFQYDSFRSELKSKKRSRQGSWRAGPALHGNEK